MNSKLIPPCTAASAPELVLSLRIRALRYYSSTSTFPSTPLQLPAFHTQHRKILLRYGRSAQAPPYEYSSERIAREAGDAFAAVLQKLPRSKASQGEGGKEWTELCQVLLGLARKVGLLDQPIPCCGADSRLDHFSGRKRISHFDRLGAPLRLGVVFS